MNLNGIIVGAATFLIIGLCHPLVIKAEYHIGKKSWWGFLFIGASLAILSMTLKDNTLSTIAGAGAFSFFWGIGEIFAQEKRVLKGWFPENPSRHDYYERLRKRGAGHTLIICGAAVSLLFISCNRQDNSLPEWALGEFVRPEGMNPVISPDSSVTFICPMSGNLVGWKESDTFNPAATVYDGRIAVLYRAEDNSAQGIGQRTSRIGLAFSTDGTSMEFRDTPVMYPDEDNAKELEWPGGCEDPRVTVSMDSTYYMMYTSWNRKVPRLCVASSKDLIHWTKHGPAFADAYDGRFADIASKSGSVVTRIDSTGRQIIAKVNGKYLMYWGEEMINLAESDDLIHWTPQTDSDGKLKGIVFPREGYFDSQLTECGPPAVLTENGIVLMYNGKNRNDDKGDKRYPSGTYSAGQILFDAAEPASVLDRLDTPFFSPSEPFEKSGQYADGTVFIEGLVLYKGKWYLYYGCADSFVGVAVFDPEK